MPALNDFEAAEHCETYCVAHVYLQPSQSELWRQIQEFSSNKYHYRHDYLKRGVCLDKCQEPFGYVEPFNVTTHNLRLVNSSEKFVVTHQQQLRASACINSIKLPQGFKAFVNVSFCITRELQAVRKGKLDAVLLSYKINHCGCYRK